MEFLCCVLRSLARVPCARYGLIRKQTPLVQNGFQLKTNTKVITLTAPITKLAQKRRIENFRVREKKYSLLSSSVTQEKRLEKLNLKRTVGDEFFFPCLKPVGTNLKILLNIKAKLIKALAQVQDELSLKVVLYHKRDQKVCLNMVMKDQLCRIALRKENEL